jgi:hypothetical protein
LEELCEEICLHFESGQIHLKHLLEQLEDLLGQLSQVQSRFIDIDSSSREDESLFQTVKKTIEASTNDEVLQTYLFEMYELIKDYLGLAYKYGEAAIWYFKNECDNHREMQKYLVVAKMNGITQL